MKMVSNLLKLCSALLLFSLSSAFAAVPPPIPPCNPFPPWYYYGIQILNGMHSPVEVTIVDRPNACKVGPDKNQYLLKKAHSGLRPKNHHSGAGGLGGTIFIQNKYMYINAISPAWTSCDKTDKTRIEVRNIETGKNCIIEMTMKKSNCSKCMAPEEQQITYGGSCSAPIIKLTCSFKSNQYQFIPGTGDQNYVGTLHLYQTN